MSVISIGAGATGALPAFAFDLNGDGVVDSMDAHHLVNRVSFGRHRADPSNGFRTARIIETPEGFVSVVLEPTASPHTDFKLISQRQIGDPEVEAHMIARGLSNAVAGTPDRVF